MKVTEAGTPPPMVFTDDKSLIIWVDLEGMSHVWWNNQIASARDVAYALSEIVMSLNDDFDLGIDVG